MTLKRNKNSLLVPQEQNRLCDYFYGSYIGFGGGGGVAADLTVGNSLCFNQPDGAVLKRTPSSASNRRTWTFSFWMKRSGALTDSTGYGIFSSYSSGNDSGYFESGIHPSEDHYFFEEWSNDIKKTTAELRDPNAWYHIVLAIDTTQSTAEDRQKVYINGVRITKFDTDNTYSEDQDLAINLDEEHWIGGSDYFGSTASTRFFAGYLAEINFADGTQYAASDFGKFNASGVWVPKKPVITYGTNGFRLEFKQTGTGTASATTIGADTSGNNNHWTSVNLAATDVMTDTPTLGWPTIASNHGRYATNIGGSHIFTQGNLEFVQNSTAAYNFVDINSIPLSSGKWYFIGEPDAIYNANGEIGLMPRKAREEAVDYYYMEDEGILYGFELSTKMDLNAKNMGVTRVLVNLPVTSATGDRQVIAVDFDAGTNGKLWAGYYDTSADELYWYKTSAAEWSDANEDIPATGSDETLALPSGYSEWMFWLRTYASRGSEIDFGSRNGGILSDITGPSGFKQINSLNASDLSTYADPTAGFQVITYEGTGANQTIVMGGNSYGHRLGSGDRSDLIVVSGTGGSTFQAIDSELVNGNYGSTDGFGYSGFATDMEIRFQFPEAVNITEIIIHRQSAGSNVGDSWIWEASNNASDWTAISGTKDYSSTVEMDVNSMNLIGANDTYIYYRCRNTNGNGVNSVMWNEFDFRVKPTDNDRAVSTFQPDLVMIKNRDATDQWCWFDSVRGAEKLISSNPTTAQATDSDTLTAFTSTGFSLGADVKVNTAGEHYVAYCWAAGGGAGSSNTTGSINTRTTSVSTTYGLSIGEFEGDGTAGSTIGHGLGVAPSLVITKNIESGETMYAGHEAKGFTHGIYLSSNAAPYDIDIYFNDTAPSSTVVTWKTHAMSNNTNQDQIVYCWSKVAGFSDFGKYVGNGSANGTVIYTGFKPALVWIRCISTSGNWFIYDRIRSPFNEVDDQLLLDATTAETTGSEEIDFLSNGFKCRTADAGINSSGTIYSYCAWADHPTWGGESVAPATAV